VEIRTPQEVKRLLYTLEDFQHLGVNGGVGGQDRLGLLEIIRSPFEVGGHAPCLLDDQPARSHIPCVEADLPVSVEAAGGHVAQVQRG